METRDLFLQAAKWTKEGVAFVLAEVVETKGSVPRKPGARMLITTDGLQGTVGGGPVEHKVINRAREMLANGGYPQLMDFDLGGKEDSVCGGTMKVFVEAFLPQAGVVVFGAGHVSAALCPLLKNLGFAVTVHDPREDRLALSEFKDIKKIQAPWNEAAKHVTFSDDLFLAVMTPGHRHDFEIVSACIEKSWAYLGVMASKKKRAELFKKLDEDNIARDLQEKLVVPIGIEIGSQTPAEIAISIAAQLVQIRAERL